MSEPLKLPAEASELIHKYGVATLRHAANAAWNKLNEASACMATHPEQARAAIQDAQQLLDVIVQADASSGNAAKCSPAGSISSFPAKLAKKLINLPAEDREWCVSHISPVTFARWSKQSGSLVAKIRSHRMGEPLSWLAIQEGSTVAPGTHSSLSETSESAQETCAGAYAADLQELEHSGVWCCERKSACKWQGFVLNHGLGWGLVPQDAGANSWRSAHSRECGVRLIQLVAPSANKPSFGLLTRDGYAGAAYLKLSDAKICKTKEFSGLVVIDYSADEQIVGVEFVGPGHP